MTTTVDFNALQAAKGPVVTLLANQDVGAGLVGGDFEDFSTFSSLCVDVNVQRKTVRTVSPSLTVLVEHSDDGLSWSTAETFSFTDDGEQTALLDSPKAHVRASASGSAAEWYVRSVNVAPIFGGGGGATPFQIIRIPLTYQTPDLVNPTGDSAVVYQPDAGTVFDFRFYVTEFFDNLGGNNGAIVYMFPRGDQSGDFATFTYDWSSSNAEIENEPGLPFSPELRPMGTDAFSLADVGRHHFYASGDCDLAFQIFQYQGGTPRTPTQGALTLIVITYPFST